jgi:hypothetical protein
VKDETSVKKFGDVHSPSVTEFGFRMKSSHRYNLAATKLCALRLQAPLHLAASAGISAGSLTRRYSMPELYPTKVWNGDRSKKPDFQFAEMRNTGSTVKYVQ